MFEFLRPHQDQRIKPKKTFHFKSFSFLSRKLPKTSINCSVFHCADCWRVQFHIFFFKKLVAKKFVTSWKTIDSRCFLSNSMQHLVHCCRWNKKFYITGIYLETKMLGFYADFSFEMSVSMRAWLSYLLNPAPFYLVF